MIRKNFTKDVRQQLCDEVGSRCSKPNCRKPTKGGGGSLGDAAHITAASLNGPRCDEGLKDQLRSKENGIWLCKTCHALIDSRAFEKEYPVELLKEWKKKAIKSARIELESGYISDDPWHKISLQLSCTVSKKDTDVCEVWVKLVNGNDSAYNLLAPYKNEITIFGRSSIQDGSNKLMMPGEEIVINSADINYSDTRSAQVTATLYCDNRKPLEITASIGELIQQAEQHQKERYISNYPKICGINMWNL